MANHSTSDSPAPPPSGTLGDNKTTRSPEWKVHREAHPSVPPPSGALTRGQVERAGWFTLRSARTAALAHDAALRARIDELHDQRHDEARKADALRKALADAKRWNDIREYTLQEARDERDDARNERGAAIAERDALKDGACWGLKGCKGRPGEYPMCPWCQRDALQRRLDDSRSLQEGTATLLGDAIAERDALGRIVEETRASVGALIVMLDPIDTLRIPMLDYRELISRARIHLDAWVIGLDTREAKALAKEGK